MVKTTKQKWVFVAATVCIVVLFVGVLYSSWSLGATDPTQQGDDATQNSTNTDAGTTDNTSTDNTSTDNTSSNNTTDTTDTSNNNDNQASSNSDQSSSSTVTNFSGTTVAEALADNSGDHEDDTDYSWDSSDVVTIILDTNAITADTETGIIIDGTTVTITSAGTYSISGTLTDGQIVVDTNSEETVRLIFNGVTVSSATNAPIYVANADKTVIVLATGTENSLIDNSNNNENSTILSKDDLTICGDGALTVIGNDNDAIHSNDGLIIESGTITVTSVDDGICGKDYIVIKGGTIKVTSVGDGLKSNNDEEEEDKGYIYIEDGTITVTSSQSDAVTAQTDLLITGGTFSLTSGGGSSTQPDSSVSTKGLKSGVSIIVDGGEFTVNCSDDAVNSDGVVVINAGDFTVSSGDEAVNSGTSIEINGGTLTITKSNDGMKSATITVNSGKVNVSSNDDGISSTNYLKIKGGTVTVNSVGDGLKADNEEDTSKGAISIDSGTITVVATQGDSITAQTDLTITGGTFSLTSGGGSAATLNDNVSTKGLKAGSSITVTGGTFTISSSDDAIHSNDAITINGGAFTVSSGDDGIHADNSVKITGGTVDINESYEGIESTAVTVNNGDITINSSDDGINLVPQTTTSTTSSTTGRPGGMGGGMGGGMETSAECVLYVNGGSVFIESGGDGIDSNGYIEMTDGILIINGPLSNANGALDAGISITISGGILVAVGSAGMAQAPNTSSPQCSANLVFGSQQSANVLVNVQTASGETVLTFSPTKTFQSLVFSCPELAMGTTYSVYLGGTSTGTSINGLYKDGTYSGGTLCGTFTLS